MAKKFATVSGLPFSARRQAFSSPKVWPKVDPRGAGGPSVTRTEMFRQALPNVRGKEVIVVSVEYAPGAGSTKHRHPGPVFAYVARGVIVSQLGTEPPVTYGEGEMWYEAPGAIHSISRNSSETEPAKLIAFFRG